MGVKTTPSCWTEFLHRKLRKHGVLFEHREAVKAHLDDLLSLQAAIDEQRDSIQESMMQRYTVLLALFTLCGAKRNCL